MFAPSISRRVCRNAQRTSERFTDHQLVRRSRRLRRSGCEGWIGGGGSPITNDSVRSGQRDPESIRGFTLLELLIVMGIVALLMVLIAPAFTTIKGGTDVTSAAYTIKGVLDTARTYAKTNNTYTWVGFYEEDVSQPSVIPAPDPQCTGCVGRLVMSIVASKDGTNVYGSGNGTVDPTKLTQVGKLTKLENIHLPLFSVCQSNCTGETFDKRPVVQNDPGGGYNYSRFGELNASQPNTAPYTTPYNFQYPVGNPAPTAQYRFYKLLQFSPRGESRVNGDSYDIRRVVEIGLLQTHGTATPPPTGSGNGGSTFGGNVVAVQINGFAGDVRIYRR
jgi:prepilin-type N-terminal cleavage/methylation domain-containing protein